MCRILNMGQWFSILVLCVVIGHGYVQSIIQVWASARLMCEDNPNILTIVRSTNNFYSVKIKGKLNASSEIKVKLDLLGTIVLDENYKSRFIIENDLINNVFIFILLQDVENYEFHVHGRFGPGHPPYVISLKINGEEKCRKPDRNYFPIFFSKFEKLWPAAPDKFCGRRKLYDRSTELIVSGSATESGKWPWHVALYNQRPNLSKYNGGGTLLSKLLVLTALNWKGIWVPNDVFIIRWDYYDTAHCVTKNGAPVHPESIGVILGKYKLLGTEVTTQNKEVFQVIVYDDFDHKKLNNDIALLKLSTEASFNNYVQPACLWFDDIYDQLDSYEISGTVVGWGVDQSESFTTELRETRMPIVPDSVYIRYNPVFYSNILNGKKYCAGYTNGTSACNGDSGGGFMVFVPDVRTPKYPYPPKDRPGAWYIRGIVSVTIAREDSSLCNPQAYTVFTDVAKYRDWILNYLH